jgi:hypothetical protein
MQPRVLIAVGWELHRARRAGGVIGLVMVMMRRGLVGTTWLMVVKSITLQ